ncbi:hypothetical protein [uncultured Shimia sp.]|uniref:hypothetical protein n=1 Tax=uncultured Shimia sp. TaxID=573152 RepID=UPI00262CDB5A|nr:hypothetical protein [uncultured Shimia sp.]
MSGLAFLKAGAFQQKLADFDLCKSGHGTNLGRKSRGIADKEKGPTKALFQIFHSPSDWPTYLLPKRYEELDLWSTGKIEVSALILLKKKAAHNVRPVSTGRSSVPNPIGLFQNSYETAI